MLFAAVIPTKYDNRFNLKQLPVTPAGRPPDPTPKIITKD